MESTSKDSKKSDNKAGSAASDPLIDNSPESEMASSMGSEKFKLGTIVQETRGLVTDLKDWVDIRVQLFQVEIEERIEDAVGKVLSIVAVGVLFLFTAFFLLIASAEALGSWIGHTAWGYLVVGVTLGLITLIVHITRPRSYKKKNEKAPGKKPELSRKADVPLLTEDSTSATTL